MYWTTPSGTRYQTGWPAATRLRQSVDEIAIAGTWTRLTASRGRWSSERSKPGRVTPTKWASSNSSSELLPRQDLVERVGPGDEEQLRPSVRTACFSSRSVSTVYVGPSRSMSTRLTWKRGLDAVAMTVIRYRSSAGLTVSSSFCQG